MKVEKEIFGKDIFRFTTATGCCAKCLKEIFVNVGGIDGGLIYPNQDCDTLFGVCFDCADKYVDKKVSKYDGNV